jgi:hypothetical protein
MTFLIPTPNQAHAGLRAIKTVLTAVGPLTAPRRETIAAVQKHLLRTEYDIDFLLAIEPEELAQVVEDPALRTQLVAGMSTLIFANDHVDPAEVSQVERFAAALQVEPGTLEHLRTFQQERFLLLRFDLARKGLAGSAIQKLYEDQGLFGVAKNVASFAGLWENKAVAAKYHALESWPDGTLGKELWIFYKKNNFQFPGEKHGAPESLLTHDLSHILGGYDVDFRSEGQVLGFQAGYRKKDPFSVIVFLLMMAEHGIRVTPFAKEQKGYFEAHPGTAEEIVRAFARGAQMNIDLTDGWDHWTVMDQPVEELRRRYGIGPKD